MTQEAGFPDLVAMVHAGDHAAAQKFMQLYWPQALRVARLRMTDSRLRQRLGPSDVCQSAFVDLYEAIASGKCLPQSPPELVRILTALVEKRAIDQARKHKAARRDVRRTEPGELGKRRIVAPGKTASNVVAEREIVENFRGRLSEEERFILEQRLDGRSWDEIGEQVGKMADAVRRQHDRALRRVRKELKLTDA